MEELNKVLSYMKMLPLQLQAGSLNNNDRTICYVIHNRLINAIDLSNPQYKTMTDLMKESVISVKEMRDDVERMISLRHSDIMLVQNITVLDALRELGSTTLDDHQNCISYLTDLAIASEIILSQNKNMEDETKILFKTLIYICVIGLNRFNKALNLPLEKEGVSISFDRKRAKQKLGV